MTENIPPHPNPLPPRGEGVRREILLPLFSKSKKEVVLQGSWQKNIKYISPSTYIDPKKRSFYNILIKKI